MVVGEATPTPRRRPLEPVEVATELEDGALVHDPDVGDELVAGVTARWRPHQHTEARATELGLDLRRCPIEEPPREWRDDAACRGVSREVADQMGECLSQRQATELVRDFCSTCMVRQQCYDAGRATRGYGVWGGLVLREGRVATWRTAKERRVGMDTETIEETMPTEVEQQRRRGQRVQPRRLTRAKRRESRVIASPLG